MKKEKVYIETTIPSYLASDRSGDIITLSRQLITERWWEENRIKYILFVSDVVIDEISDGNKKYAKKRIDIIKECTILETTDKVSELVNKYQKHFNFPDTILRDLSHIAYCVNYEIDFLITWNCTHLANVHFTKQLERLNEKYGLKTPKIITPELLMD